MMKPRQEAARYAEILMKKGVPKKQAFHFGKLEVRALLDFIYESTPNTPEEEVFEPLRLRNSKVGKWR